MSSYPEQQAEEREVLQSIYDGDPSFKELNPTTYQYKFGEDGDPKSFLLEISWGQKYPDEKPDVNMDAFYNKHIIQIVKDHIKKCVLQEAEDYLGNAMTFSLFESVKEKLNELVVDQPEKTLENGISDLNIQNVDEDDDDGGGRGQGGTGGAVKKSALSKAQKRKQWDRVDARGERPRGYDWVDIVKHLSQTGSKADATS
ncbi:RWD domain-containing protein 4 [Nilaparvata lugens]|uniref:RWD domain-containing protein 4 n=1 Tax=Nilaparvata lugens TaxID=108931 RepID=UPI000B989345|nr:RWD domain-containing protein 4 [Nilaparvata lugens]XP_039277745.1 RWD domain-containing protein 4 [Nilaparvata lugens]XP_039277746.1 RWD domain-containing protein 4 [Nilaparvata lugens]XP_039277747.1 RWD domain-containing protein 4 [Nilaparvata lugens]